MTSLMLEMGSELEKFDMGDAFVGAWDVANLVSDFILERMGAETSECSKKAPPTLGAEAAQAPEGSRFRLTTASVRRMEEALASEFSRYRFLKDFMNEDDPDWSLVNTIVAVYQGYRPEDEDGPGAEEPVREAWRRCFPGPFPPDVRTAEGIVEALEVDYPDDPDLVEGLDVIIETIYGGYAMKVRHPSRFPTQACGPEFLKARAPPGISEQANVFSHEGRYGSTLDTLWRFYDPFR